MSYWVIVFLERGPVVRQIRNDAGINTYSAACEYARKYYDEYDYVSYVEVLEVNRSMVVNRPR